MTPFRTTLFASLILISLGRRSADAQQPGSLGTVHTVSVTVPPRVKVQVAPFASTQSAAAADERGNVAFSFVVSASRSWAVVLTRAGRASSARRDQRYLQSATQRRAVTDAEIVRGARAHGTSVKFYAHYLRNAGSPANPVVLTLTAP